MSTLVIPSNPPANFNARDFFSSFGKDEPRFFVLGLLLAAAMLPTGFAALVDNRTFLGVDVWQKPLKFEFALVVYLLTLVFFARFLPQGTSRSSSYRLYSSAVVVAIAFEMIWIAGAAGLGTASHFNRTPVGGAFYSLAGAGAVMLTTPTAVYAWLIFRNRHTGLSPAVREAVIAGLALTLPLTLMTAGTMAQLGGHQIGGVPGDAGGLALMGWARDAGDLRVSHFLGTHAMHVIPIFGVVSALAFGGGQKLPVRLFALAYVGLVGWTFVEALAGRPFLPFLGA